MNDKTEFFNSIKQFAHSRKCISGLVLIGSRARSVEDIVWRSDAHSDWDFQVISSKTEAIAKGDWAKDLFGVRLRSFVARDSRLGSVTKINVVLADCEADFVLIPSGLLRIAQILLRLGYDRRSTRFRRGLQNLAIIIRPGYTFVIGDRRWGSFYNQVISRIEDPRLSNSEIIILAAGFVSDYISIKRKIQRGEVRSAQRLIHRDLAEVNFKLLHELRLRLRERSFPEARRIESIADSDALSLVSVNAKLIASELMMATEKCASSLRHLTNSLVGSKWTWPIVN